MRTRLNWAVLSFLVVLAFAAGSARAAEDPQRAKELFQEGTTFFDLGQFDKAIEAWQEGYKAKPDPGFLFNIAQAYRLAGDAQKAIFFYRGYLRNSPKAPNRAEVEQKIAALQKQAGDPDKGKTPPAPPPRPEASAPSSSGSTPAPASGTTVASSSGSPPSPAVTAPPPAPEDPTPPAPPQPEPTVVATPAPTAAGEARPFDVSAGIGPEFW